MLVKWIKKNWEDPALITIQLFPGIRTGFSFIKEINLLILDATVSIFLQRIKNNTSWIAPTSQSYPSARHRHLDEMEEKKK